MQLWNEYNNAQPNEGEIENKSKASGVNGYIDIGLVSDSKNLGDVNSFIRSSF